MKVEEMVGRYVDSTNCRFVLLIDIKIFMWIYVMYVLIWSSTMVL